jgi:hypothetical protein
MQLAGGPQVLECIPAGHQHHRLRTANAAHQIIEQLEGGFVRPVQVFPDQQQGLHRGGLMQQHAGQGFDQQHAPLGRQCDQSGCGVTHQLGHQGRGIGLEPEMALQGLLGSGDGIAARHTGRQFVQTARHPLLQGAPRRRALAFAARENLHLATGLAHVLHHGVGQQRFADARLASYCQRRGAPCRSG